MKHIMLTLSILIFSPIVFANSEVMTVFTWLDDDGVMHFTDEKPSELGDQTLMTVDVEDKGVLGMPNIKTQVAQPSEGDKQAIPLPGADSAIIALTNVSQQQSVDNAESQTDIVSNTDMVSDTDFATDAQLDIDVNLDLDAYSETDTHTEADAMSVALPQE